MSFRRPSTVKTEPSRGLFGTTVWIVVSRTVSVVAAGVVAALTARQLGPTGRVFVLLITVAPFTMLICGLGANVAARIHLVEREHPTPLGHYLGLSFALSAVQGVACVLTGVVLLPVAGANLTAGELGAFVVMGATLLLRSMWLSSRRRGPTAVGARRGPRSERAVSTM